MAVLDYLFENSQQRLALCRIEACKHIALARSKAAKDFLVQSSPGIGEVKHAAAPVNRVDRSRDQFLFLKQLDGARNAGLGSYRLGLNGRIPSDEMTRFVCARKEIRVCLEAEITGRRSATTGLAVARCG